MQSQMKTINEQFNEAIKHKISMPGFVQRFCISIMRRNESAIDEYDVCNEWHKTYKHQTNGIKLLKLHKKTFLETAEKKKKQWDKEDASKHSPFRLYQKHLLYKKKVQKWETKVTTEQPANINIIETPKTTNKPKTDITKIYKQNNLIYIQYDAPIIENTSGQKKIGGGDKRPSYKYMTTQQKYDKGSYYSLLMDREFQPGKYTILVDLDNKNDEKGESGLKLIDMFNLDKYNAPKQQTPSKGLHYLFYVNEEQRQQLGKGNKTTLTINNNIYHADIKFGNGLLNCEPSTIKNYGSYKWVNPEQLSNIPQLPEELYEIIVDNLNKKGSKTNNTIDIDKTDIMQNDVEDIYKLLSCLNMSRLDNYSNWINLGICLKKLGADVKLWDDISKQHDKYKSFECVKKWDSMRNITKFNMGTMCNWAKFDNYEKYIEVLPYLKFHLHNIFNNEEEYEKICINTNFLVSNNEEMNEGQNIFKKQTDDFFEHDHNKNLVIRSKYGSGKTTFLKDVMMNQDVQRVLIITYRQTLALDYNRNFKQLGFANYLDSYEQPDIYNENRLIVQIDSLMKVMTNNDEFILNGEYDGKYDLIVLDEIESLLSHIDEQTMKNKDIQTFSFLDKLLLTSKKIISLDGDMSNRSLSFLNNYGAYKYIYNESKTSDKTIRLVRNKEIFNYELFETLTKLDKTEKIAIVCQSPSVVESLKDDIKLSFSNLIVSTLTGLDDADTKRKAFDNINETVNNCNVFIYSPVIESGVDITVKIKKVMGVLTAKSNSQRAFMQMLARCRNVEDNTIILLNDEHFKIYKNCHSVKMWTFSEVKQLINDNDGDKQLIINEHEKIEFRDTTDRIRMNNSIYNTVEKLNKHPSIYISYLQILACNKGYKFVIDEKDERKKPPKEQTQNYKVEMLLNADDIDDTKYNILLEKRRKQQTTFSENFMIDKHYYKKLLNVDQLSKDMIKPFLYDDIVHKFKTLIDDTNLDLKNNLQTKQDAEKVKYARLFIKNIGFNNCIDNKTQLIADTIISNFKNNFVNNEDIQNKSKYLNQLFELNKNYKLTDDMTTKQILGYLNSIINKYSVSIYTEKKNIRRGDKVEKVYFYKLRVDNNIIDIVKRQHEKRNICKDNLNLLNLPVEVQNNSPHDLDDMFDDE